MVADELFLWWLGDDQPKRLVGTLRLLRDTKLANGVSLEYHPAWLQNGFALSEDLPLRAGEVLPHERGAAAGVVDDARPKAQLLIDSEPWLIKFTEYGDVFDSPALEHAAMTLARSAGIDSCETRLLAFESSGKNSHALLARADGLLELAPAFDVLPSGLGLGYQQMRVGIFGAISTIKNALSDAASFRMSQTKARDIAAEVANAVSAWRTHFSRAGVAEKDIEGLAQYIDGSQLLSQRILAKGL